MCAEIRSFSRRQWENRGFLAVLGCKRCGSAIDGVLAVSEAVIGHHKSAM